MAAKGQGKNTTKIMMLFLDGEVRTLEEIREWMRRLTKPEVCYRAWVREYRREPESQEQAVREGINWVVHDAMRQLVYRHEWLSEADNKLEEGVPMSVVNGSRYSFRITEKGKQALRGKAFEDPRVSKSFGTFVWASLRKLFEDGKIRLQVRGMDGSPLSASALSRNGEEQRVKQELHSE